MEGEGSSSGSQDRITVKSLSPHSASTSQNTLTQVPQNEEASSLMMTQMELDDTEMRAGSLSSLSSVVSYKKLPLTPRKLPNPSSSNNPGEYQNLPDIQTLAIRDSSLEAERDAKKGLSRFYKTGHERQTRGRSKRIHSKGTEPSERPSPHRSQVGDGDVSLGASSLDTSLRSNSTSLSCSSQQSEKTEDLISQARNTDGSLDFTKIEKLIREQKRAFRKKLEFERAKRKALEELLLNRSRPDSKTKTSRSSRNGEKTEPSDQQKRTKKEGSLGSSSSSKDTGDLLLDLVHHLLRKKNPNGSSRDSSTSHDISEIPTPTPTLREVPDQPIPYPKLLQHHRTDNEIVRIDSNQDHGFGNYSQETMEEPFDHPNVPQYPTQLEQDDDRIHQCVGDKENFYKSTSLFTLPPPNLHQLDLPHPPLPPSPSRNLPHQAPPASGRFPQHHFDKASSAPAASRNSRKTRKGRTEKGVDSRGRGKRGRAGEEETPAPEIQQSEWWWVESNGKPRNGMPPSLPKFLEDRRARFIANSKSRQEKIAAASFLRKQLRREEKELAEDVVLGRRTMEEANRLIAARQDLPEPAAFCQKQMVAQTKKKFYSLPEYQERQRKVKDQFERATYRVAARMYQQVRPSYYDVPIL